MMINCLYGFLILTCVVYICFGVFIKDEIRIKFMQRILGYLIVPISFIAITVLSTSDNVINKVVSKFGSVEPRLKNIEHKLIRIDTVQTVMKSDQKQLKKLVNEMIELVNLERKSPKPTIMWGPKAEKAAKEYDEKIEAQKEKLKSIVKTK